MSDFKPNVSESVQRSNRRLAVICVGFFAGMLGMAYAAVPLYDMFCRVTGYGGRTQQVEQYSQVILDKDVHVRFDANVSGGLAWQFRPKQREVTLKMGETTQVSYEATNISNKPVMGRATFNVTPLLAGAYFMKVECFCFTDTVLQPGETLDMPVVFYVDPEIADVPEFQHINTITLSYTFFPMDKETTDTSAVMTPGTTLKNDADTSFGG